MPIALADILLATAAAVNAPRGDTAPTTALTMAIVEGGRDGILQNVDLIVTEYTDAATKAGRYNSDTLKSRKTEWEQARKLGAATFGNRDGFELALVMKRFLIGDAAEVGGGFREGFKRGATWLSSRVGTSIDDDELKVVMAKRSGVQADLLRRIVETLIELHTADSDCLKRHNLLDAAIAFEKAHKERALGKTSVELAGEKRRKPDPLERLLQQVTRD